MKRIWWLGLITVACGAPGSLVFRRNVDSTVVNQNGILNGRAWTPAESDLATARGTCIEELSAELLATPLAGTKVSSAPQSELQIYARDPNEMESFLASLTRDDIERGLAVVGPSAVAQGIWNPGTADPTGFARVVALGWPSPPGTVNAPVSRTPLDSARFWGAGPASPNLTDTQCHPKGDPATLAPGGSLKRVVIYNRGTCHRQVPLEAFLAAGNDQLVQSLHSQLQPGIGSVKVSYSILQSSVELPGAVLDDPIQSVFLMLLYVARDLLGNSASSVWGTVRYAFALDANGAVFLEPHEVAWHPTGVLGPASSEGSPGIPGWHGALTQPDGLAVARLNRSIRNQQLLGVKAPFFGAQLTAGTVACDSGSFAQQCGAAANGVAVQMEMLLGMHPQFSDAEVDRMLCAVGHQARCSKLGRSAADVVKKNWVCDTSSLSLTRRYCDMVIPAERLIAMPDALGVVFFDGDAFDSAAYTLQAVALATQSPALCGDDTVPNLRSFAASVLRDPRQ